MFKCDMTGKVSKPGEKPVRVVVERREKVYRDDEGRVLGRGWEIAKELTVSVEGLMLLQGVVAE